MTGANSYTFTGQGYIGGTTALTVQGPGKLTVANSGGNNYTGGTYVNGGALALGVNNGLPVAGTLTLGAASGNGTFDLAGYSQTLGGLAVGNGANAGGQVVGNSVPSTVSTLTYSNTADPTAFGGTIQDGISGGGGQVALTVAAGLLNLSGSNTYSGATTVGSGGTLQLGSGSALYSGAATGNATVNGVLDLGGNNAGIGALSGAGTVTNSGISASTLTVGSDNASGTFAGSIQDGAAPVALTKNGTGTEVLTGANAYSGGTIVNAGVLAAVSSQQLVTGSITANPGGTMSFNSNTPASQTSFGGNITISGSGSNGLGALQLNAATGAAGVSLTGNIQGSGGVTNIAGLNNLSGANSYSGPTLVMGGTLQAGQFHGVRHELARHGRQRRRVGPGRQQRKHRFAY